MAISHSAISCKGLLLGLFFTGITVFSADAMSAGRPYLISFQVEGRDKDFQDNKRVKDKKQEDPETRKPGAQRVDPDRQDPKKPEIKEVPKARKQLKPSAVKPKVKPVRIVKPKIKKH